MVLPTLYVTMSEPVPLKDVSPNPPLITLIVAEFAAPLAPVNVGAAVNMIVETLAAGVVPRFVPRNNTVAPAVRDNEAKVKVVDPPDPGVTVTILCPVESVKAPVDSEALVVLLPVKLKLPPFMVRAEEDKRFNMLVVLLSTVKVAPELMVTAEEGMAPDPLKITMPALRIVAPVILL